MKTKVIRLEINIESEICLEMRADFTISDIIFTEYSTLLDYDKLAENYKTAIKKLGKFTMLTAQLSVYDKGDYMLSSKQFISSFRFVNRYNELTMSRWNGDCYNDFQPSTKNDILKMVKELVEKGNQKYIELIRLNEVNN